MKKTFLSFTKAQCTLLMMLCMALGSVTMTSCSDDDDNNDSEPVSVKLYSSTTQELIDLVESTPQLKSLLIKAIDKAKQINPDRATNPAQTLDEYYDFIEWSTTAMPWCVLQQSDGTSLFDKIDQSLDYFYFINDVPLDELDGQGLYNNSIQYIEPYRTWLVDYCKDWGAFLSTEASWNDEYAQTAMQDPLFGLQNGWYEDPSNWHSFNDFFARYLSSPDMRPISSPDDDTVIDAAADSQPQGVWAIDENSDIVQNEGVVIKSKKFNSVSELLGPNSQYKDAFASGTLTHSFLDVNDYHRYHFAVSGTVKEINIIPADDAVGGIITWSPELNKYLLSCDTPGWQSIETRGCVIVETDNMGLVALLPIGMSQVSSVNFLEGIKAGDKVKKGDMLGYFMFGGSDFVILFQKGVKFTLTPQQKDNGSYPHMLMGEELGRVSL